MCVKMPLPLGRMRLQEELVLGTDFARNVVPRMASLVEKTQMLVRGVKCSTKNSLSTICISRLQALCLLCNAFFDLLQENEGDFPPLPNFKTVRYGHPLWPFFEHYFAVATLIPEEELANEVVVISRLQRTRDDVNLSQSARPMIRPAISCKVTIESALDCDAHVNFANAFLSGHLFQGAIAQEEILFAMRPELCACAILCERMCDDEAVAVTGTRQYSNAIGYGRRVKCQPLDEPTRHPSTILCIDAQYGCLGRSKSDMDRDLFKALTAFKGPTVRTVSTGRWGCGMFAKHPELTFLQQWIAASEVIDSTIFIL